jgi:hypothetical protein
VLLTISLQTRRSQLFLLGSVVPECGDTLWRARLLPVRPTRDALMSKPVLFVHVLLLHYRAKRGQVQCSDLLSPAYNIRVSIPPVSYLVSRGLRGHIQALGTIAILPRQPTIISNDHHINLSDFTGFFKTEAHNDGCHEKKRPPIGESDGVGTGSLLLVQYSTEGVCHF